MLWQAQSALWDMMWSDCDSHYTDCRRLNLGLSCRLLLHHAEQTKRPFDISVEGISVRCSFSSPCVHSLSRQPVAMSCKSATKKKHSKIKINGVVTDACFLHCVCGKNRNASGGRIFSFEQEVAIKAKRSRAVGFHLFGAKTYRCGWRVRFNSIMKDSARWCRRCDSCFHPYCISSSARNMDENVTPNKLPCHFLSSSRSSRRVLPSPRHYRPPSLPPEQSFQTQSPPKCQLDNRRRLNPRFAH